MNQINIHTIDWKRVAITILTIFVLVLLSLNFAQCENNKTALATIEAQNSQISTYKLRNGQLVTSVQTLQFSNDQLEDLVLSQDAEMEEMAKHFSKVKTITKVVTNTIIDSIPMPYEVEAPCVFEKTGIVENSNYNLKYFSNQKGIRIDSLNIPNTMTYVSGVKRKWFWGKETNTIDITASNPLVKIDSIQHIEIQEPKKWYQTNGAKMGGAIIIFEVLKAIIIN